MWDLIVSVSDHCLSFYFTGRTTTLLVLPRGGLYIFDCVLTENLTKNKSGFTRTFRS